MQSAGLGILFPCLEGLAIPFELCLSGQKELAWLCKTWGPHFL